jgi:SpoU rRNA methylase family enzyme
MIVVFHEPVSGAILIDFAKIVLNSKAKLLVISRPQATALHHGVPEISFLSYKLGKQILFVNSLEQAVEILNPNRIFLVNPKSEKSYKEYTYKENDMIIFCGNPYINDKYENIKILDEKFPVLANLVTFLLECKLLY